jgi:glycosyltransferase involved in cell wall biosynthesis
LSSFAEKTIIDNGFPADRIYKTYLGINQAVFTPKKHYNLPENDVYTEGSFSELKTSLRGTKQTNLELKSTKNEVYTEGSLFELKKGNLASKNGEKPLELYFVGTLSYRKGLPFMMQLLDALIKRTFNVRLTLIGPVDDFPIPEINAPYFRYFPFLNHAELVKMHHDLDLFIFPSNIDSWAQVVIEAMACGSPVLVSENTGAKDAVAQGGGVVLPVNNLQEWVNSIEFYHNNRHFLQKTGEKAASVAKQYSWEAYHEQVFEVMEDIKKRSLA